MGCGSSRDLPLAQEDEAETPLKVDKEEESEVICNKSLEEDDKSPPDDQSNKIDTTVDQQYDTNNIDLDQENLPPNEEAITRPTSESGSKKGENVSFEVVDESLIRKHPPKKFQRLEDIQMGGGSLTPEELEMKQEIARKRRQNLLNKRVQSAKERSAKSAHIRSNTEENNEHNDGAIESPEDI